MLRICLINLHLGSNDMRTLEESACEESLSTVNDRMASCVFCNNAIFVPPVYWLNNEHVAADVACRLGSEDIY